MDKYTGIDLTLSGTDGTDWMDEFLSSDQAQQPRRVTAILSTTQISLAHNVNNTVTTNPIGSGNYIKIGLGYAGDPANSGTIRYRVDRNTQKGFNKFSTGDTAAISTYPAYSTPLTFATLEYAPGSAVLGATGATGGAWTQANRAVHYFRGHLDYANQEWHEVVYWDDDYAWLNPIFRVNHLDKDGNPTDVKAEYAASDGTIRLFVVDPTAPWQKFTASGTGAFWTSEPKAYDTPKIHQQRTVICCGTSGGISVELRDLFGRNIFYRVVTDAADVVTAYTAVGAATVTLTESSFPVGTRYLQYYSTGFAGNVKTRQVLRIQNTPMESDFPSYGEGHGNLVVGSSARWTEITAAVNRSPYSTTWAKLQTDDGTMQASNFDASIDMRWPWANLSLQAGGGALRNAVVAKLKGFTFTKTGLTKSFGQYALEMTLYNPGARVDPIGFETLHSSGSHPSVEQIGAGYYFLNQVVETMRAYDIIAGFFRSDQVTGGLTVIQDYTFREQAFKWAFQSAYLLSAAMTIDMSMWDTARCIGGFLVAAMLPKYSEPVFGTSGFDGVTTTTYLNCPYPDTGRTMWTLLAERRVPTESYPNQALQFNPDIPVLWLANGNWAGPNLGYASLMSRPMNVFLFTQAISAPLTTPLVNVNEGMKRAIAGTLAATNPSASLAPYTPQYISQSALGNSFIPYGGLVVAAVKNPPNTNTPPVPVTTTETQQVLNDLADGILYYVDTTPAAGTVATPSSSAESGSYESAVTVTLTCATPLATIRYTTNGTDPTSGSTAYTVPLVISVNTVLKAKAFKTDVTDSGILQVDIVMLPDGQPAAPRNFRVRGFRVG